MLLKEATFAFEALHSTSRITVECFSACFFPGLRDGVVEEADYELIQAYILKRIDDLPAIDGYTAGDVDGDGMLTASDLARITRYLSNMPGYFTADRNGDGLAEENETHPNYSDPNPFRYCGEYFDKETGTIYLRARYYNPVVGRFITEDSNRGKDKDPLSLNLYTYVYNNPINYFDPTGHFGWGDVWNGIKSIAKGVKDFVQGVGSGVLESVSYNESDKIEVYYDRDNELIYLIGKTVGSGAMTVIGAISTTACAAGDVIVAPTGVGELVTVPATVYCGTVTVSAATNTGANIAKIINEVKSSGGSSGGSYKKYSPDQIEKNYGLKKGQFHKEVKQDILANLTSKNSPYKDLMKKMGNNPDVYLDSSGNIQIVSTAYKGKSFVTDLNINNFIP